MSTLRIAGHVRYSDMQTPVANARVRIYDTDVGGDGDDLILSATTDASGRFSGRSADWKDRNTIRVPVLGETATPDLMLLEFRVDFGSHTHRGPFVHIGDNNSAPIVVPVAAPASKLARQQCELLQVITLSAESRDKALYETIEFGSKAAAGALAASRYRQHTAIEAREATLKNLRVRLDELAARADTRAIDLIFNTHGSSEHAYFFPNEETSMGAIVSELQRIPAARRRKLRAVFSTACFGATHLDGWLDAGFKVASGSRGIYADSALSFPAFLAAWASGANFAAAVSAANASDPLRAQDALASEYYRSGGQPGLAAQVNSVRILKGNGALKADSSPT